MQRLYNLSLLRFFHMKRKNNSSLEHKNIEVRTDTVGSTGRLYSLYSNSK